MNPDRAEERELDWRAYLSEFHADRTGIIEAVLSRAMAGDHSPYRWLARAVSESATTVVDLACGSAMSRELGAPRTYGRRARYLRA